jgi:acyl carrier protein
MVNLTAEAVLAELQPIFEEALDEPGITIKRTSSAWNTPNWDSLAHIDLIEMAERHFKIKLTLVELQEIREAGDLADLIVQKAKQG